MLYGYIIILSLSMVLIGYSVGRRVGIREGAERTKHSLALDYKLLCLQQNQCPVCKK